MKTSTRIDDITFLGEELTDEQLRLAAGGTDTGTGFQVTFVRTGPDGRWDGYTTSPLDPSPEEPVIPF
jgi:hypothetical protein